MSNPNKRKGTLWESAIVTFIRERIGLRAYRPAQSGLRDEGDIHGVDPFILQAKDDKSFAISKWVADAEAQAVNAGQPFAAVVVKKRRASTGRAYVIQSLDQWVQVLALLRAAKKDDDWRFE